MRETILQKMKIEQRILSLRLRCVNLKECDVIKQEPWGLPVVISAMIAALIGIATAAKLYGLTISAIAGLVIIAFWGWVLYDNCKSVYTRLRLYTDRIEHDYKNAKEKADKYDNLLLQQTIIVSQSNNSIGTTLESTSDKSKSHTQSRIE
ncbi:hypothetical protein [Lactiplantibacillus herbarum]|uniref:hypothetical protein n=1 Tax=Lactiplantibacillus herbarum TaxID=1670446 RepID=UPI00128D9C25|nr:hypothetical protein [Lactiplantibacillus herbarum]